MSSQRAKVFKAPGRVNLIGEHTDYTGGFVLPMAIPFATTVKLDTTTKGYHFESSLFPAEPRTLTLADRSPRIGSWSDYPVGTLRELQQLGVTIPPFRMLVRGDVPLGAGLSSSASIEVATAIALLEHAGARLPLTEIALLCQRAENRYLGSPCGIMDQFASIAARAGHALLLNTRTLDFEHLPMNGGKLAECRIVIVNSGVKHTISDGSDYAARRAAAEEGQQVLRQRFGVRDLGDARLDQLDACREQMTEDAFKRCRHILSENGRVQIAAAAMRDGDPVTLGKAMLGSHASQRDDFECSVEAVDFLVETAMMQTGCHGSRLTGGGFGGCTVSLVENEAVDAFVSAVQRAYRERHGRIPDAFVCAAADGAVAQHPEVLAA